jgi:hypothetical protein
MVDTLPHSLSLRQSLLVMSSARIEEIDRDASDPLSVAAEAIPKDTTGEATRESLVTEPTPRTLCRHITAEMRGSLTKLAAGGVAVKWSLDDTAVTVFRPSSADKGFSDDAEGCDIKNAVLHELQVVEVRSNFPCSLGLSISGVAGTHFSKVRPRASSPPRKRLSHSPRRRATSTPRLSCQTPRGAASTRSSRRTK